MQDNKWANPLSLIIVIRLFISLYLSYINILINFIIY